MAELTSTVQQFIEQSAFEDQNREDIGPMGALGGAVPKSKRRARITDEGPQVNSVNNLHAYGEAVTTKDGRAQFKFTFVCFIDDDDIAYFGQTRVSRFCLTPKVLQECLKRIPDENIYPQVSADIINFSSSVTRSLYIKRPDLKSWDDFEGTDFLLKLFLGEVETFELLCRNPHLNIVRYHGCTVNRGRITGIVLDRHPMTLEQRFQDETRDFSTESLFKDLESAVKHLHSLGLAHNDLNPAHIMLDKH